MNNKRKKIEEKRVLENKEYVEKINKDFVANILFSIKHEQDMVRLFNSGFTFYESEEFVKEILL